MIQDAKCYRRVIGQPVWDSVANKRENILGEEERNDSPEYQKKARKAREGRDKVDGYA